MSDSQFPDDSFPRQQARTRHYTLGRPRTFTVADDGSRVAFLRSRASDDPVGSLWVFDVASAEERLVFGPAMDRATSTSRPRSGIAASGGGKRSRA